MQIYSDKTRAKPCIVVSSGVGIFDTLTNGSDHYHLHPGTDLQDMHRFADALVHRGQMAILAQGPIAEEDGKRWRLWTNLHSTKEARPDWSVMGPIPYFYRDQSHPVLYTPPCKFKLDDRLAEPEEVMPAFVNPSSSTSQVRATCKSWTSG